MLFATLSTTRFPSTWDLAGVLGADAGTPAVVRASEDYWRAAGPCPIEALFAAISAEVA